MDKVISFTPSQIVSVILAVCAGIATVGGAACWVYKAIKKVQEPNAKQDERIAMLEGRIAELEERINRHDELFANDKRSIEAVMDGSRVTQRAILALLEHGINGNNKVQMETAKHELEKYLIER